MRHHLTEEQSARYQEFREFARLHVGPEAETWDREQRIPAATISSLAASGYLGSTVPSDYGGQHWDAVTFGLLSEALGRESSALTGVITVQAMVSMTLLPAATTSKVVLVRTAPLSSLDSHSPASALMRSSAVGLAAFSWATDGAIATIMERPITASAFLCMRFLPPV